MDRKKYIEHRRIMLLGSVFLLFFVSNQGFAESVDSLVDSQRVISADERHTLATNFMARIGRKFDQMLSDDSYLKGDSVLTNYDKYQTRLQSINEGEELILLVATDKIILSEALIGLKKNNTVYISLFEFLSAVDFPININMDSQTATGWFIAEGKTFYLDVTQAFVEADGRRYTIKDKDIISDGSDMLIRFDTLAQWFDLDLEADLEMMAIVVDSETPLPIETQLLRDRRADDFKYESRRPVLPYKKEPYRAITEPFADVQLGASYSKRKNVDVSKLGRYSVIAANDLGYMNAKTYVQGTTEEPLQDVRITLNRKADEGGTLGPLGVDEVNLGDITPTRLAIVSDAGQERGVRLSSNIGDKDISDTIQLQGDVQPGWDVELYRNDILIGIQQVDSSGHYDFQNVELYFGNNDFRTVFYGPQGQIREETESIPIFGNRLKKGEGAYDVSLTQRDEVTYRANESGTVDQGAPAFVSRYEHGLTDDILGFAGVRAWQRSKKAELLGVAGLQTSKNNFLYTVNAAQETDGGTAVEAIAQGLVGKNKTLRLRQQLNTDDFDIDAGSGLADVSQTEARLQGRLGRKTGFSLLGEHTVAGNSQKRSQVSANVGTNIRRLNFNKELIYTNDDTDTVQDRVRGSLGVNGVYSGMHWRTRATYDVKPEPEVNSFLVSGLKSVNTNLSAELELENFLNTDLTEGRLSMNYRNDKFILTPRLSYDSDQEATAFLTMNFGLGRNPYSGKALMTRNRMTNSGAIAARAFLDENANGVYDGGEELLEGVSVISKTDSKRGKTDETGWAFIPNVQEDRLTDVTVDREKFADPFWIATYEGHSVKPRAGVINRIDFPIAVAGEIDGVINIIGKNKKNRPARQMVVELMTADREVIQTEKTAYDGFYLFQDVPPGDYIVNIPENEAKIRGLRSANNYFVDVNANGTVETGLNFTMYSSELDDVTVAQLQKQNTGGQDNLMVLRLGSYNSGLLRMLKWVRLKKTHPDIFANLRPQFDDKGDKKYLDIGPFYSANHANEVCQKIQGIEEDCAIRPAIRKSSLNLASSE